MDASRVSRRLGAEVTILYRRRIADMPADTEEIHESQEEGCRIVTQAIPVEVLGTLEGDEQLARVYAAADVFVAPSRQDNLPNTVVESLACGTPVVATPAYR